MSDTWKFYTYNHICDLTDGDPSGDPIMELSDKPNVYDHHRLDGKTYVVCYIRHDHVVGVSEINLDQDHDTEDTEYMVCPHCGYADYDSAEFRNDEDTRDCGGCGLEFSYTREVQITYTTEKVTK